MSVVKISGRVVRDTVAAVLIIVAVPAFVWFALGLGKLGVLAAAGLVGLIVGVYVGLRHPLWLYWALAIFVAALPFGYFPGIHLPLYLTFAAGALLASVIHPTPRRRFQSIEKAVVWLVVVSGLALLFGGVSLQGVLDFAKWAMATLFTVALLRLSREQMAKFGRIFVYTAALNAVYGLFVVIADPQRKSFALLHVFGYGLGSGPDSLVYSFASDVGGSTSLRLGGTWVEPNGAGLNMLFALAIGAVVLQGWRRNVVSAIFVVAIALTLSRSAAATLVVALLLLLLFHSMSWKTRTTALVFAVAVPALALTVPTIRARMLSTFSNDDPGANDRSASLREFPHTMSGHWLFGLGWGRPELRQGDLAYQINYVSNAPLLTVYRGGIFAGIAFVLVLIVGCIVGYRALRSPSTPHAVAGAIFISSSFVALQLDHPVASGTQVILVFGTYLAFLVYVDETPTAALAPTSRGKAERRMRAVDTRPASSGSSPLTTATGTAVSSTGPPTSS